MYVIEIQPVDYDDYPMGQPMRIGPFTSDDEAYEFMKNSGKFAFFSNYRVWKSIKHVHRHTVRVRELAAGLMAPEDF